jgi:hypothetical protein
MSGSHGNGRVPGEADGTEDGWVVLMQPAPEPDTAAGTAPTPDSTRASRKRVVTDLSLTIVVVLCTMAFGALALAAWLGLVTLGTGS